MRLSNQIEINSNQFGCHANASKTKAKHLKSIPNQFDSNLPASSFGTNSKDINSHINPLVTSNRFGLH